jgi:ketosteroid isomerase-like protein
MRDWISLNLLSVSLMIATILSASPLAQQATGHEDEQAKAAVAHLEEEWLNALNKADVNAIAEILGDDFIRPDPNSGEFVNKADLLPYYRSHLSPQGPDQRRIEDMTVSLYGTTALARGVLTTTDSRGRIIRRLLFTDVFVLRRRKWQAVSAQENIVTLPQTQAR